MTITREQKIKWLNERSCAAMYGHTAATIARAILADLEAPEPAPEWRCFHCDEIFTERNWAAEHFGATEWDTPACKHLVEGGSQLIALLRDQERQLESYRGEDSRTLRAIAAMQADRAQALKREEEKGYARGYARGLADGIEEAARRASLVTPSSVSHTGEAHMRSYRDAIIHAIKNPNAAITGTLSPDEVAGIAWFNSLSEQDRALWLSRAGSAVPADAWRAYKSHDPLRDAAPALLAALEEMVKWRDSDKHPSELFDQARAAIAAARGTKP